MARGPKTARTADSNAWLPSITPPNPEPDSASARSETNPGHAMEPQEGMLLRNRGPMLVRADNPIAITPNPTPPPNLSAAPAHQTAAELHSEKVHRIHEQAVSKLVDTFRISRNPDKPRVCRSSANEWKYRGRVAANGGFIEDFGSRSLWWIATSDGGPG